MSSLFVRVAEGRNLRAADRNGLSDPYAVIKLDGKQKQSSQVIPKSLNPVWHEDFSFVLKEDSKVLEIEVFDKDVVGTDHLGQVHIDLRTAEFPMHAWLNLIDKKSTEGEGKILVSLVRQPNDIGNIQVPQGLSNDQLRRHFIDSSQLTFLENKQQVSLSDGLATSQNITVWVGTFNMGNEPPPASDMLRLWLKPGSDIYAVGVQECTYDVDGKRLQQIVASALADDWDRRIRAVLNDSGDEEKVEDPFVLVQHESLMKIRMNVYIRKSQRQFIHNVESGREATGLANVVGNKGGVCVSFNYHDTSLAFISSHLAAHQEKVERRNADMKEIVAGIKLGEKHIDILTQFDHLFWAGDLNYRVEWGDKPLDRVPSEEVFNEMVKMVEDGRFEELYAKDQLVREMAAGNAFGGFHTPPCNFVPTFKVKVGEKLTYNKKRFPAYTDRIMTRSLVPHLQPQVLSYDAVPEVTSSDHKPVYATYKVTVGDLPPAVDVRRGRLSLRITNLKGWDIPAMDQGGTSDPYVVFLAPWLPDKKFRTPQLPKTLTPEWTDEQVPLLESFCNNPERLKLQPLKMKMYDHDKLRSETIGTAMIQLDDLAVAGQRVEFKAQLRRGGQAYGWISGNIQAVWAEKHLGRK